MVALAASSDRVAAALPLSVVLVEPPSLDVVGAKHPLGFHVQLNDAAPAHSFGFDAHKPSPTPVWHQPHPSMGVQVPHDV